MPQVDLVVVSHSRLIADGVVEVARQMAPDVAVLPAGGDEDGGIGTSLDRVLAAVEQSLAAGRSCVLLTDLGSATMTAELAVETCSSPEDVTLVDAPVVEGAVAAAVAAQGGADLAATAAAARQAAGAATTVDAGGVGAAGTPAVSNGGWTTATARVVNPLGLHARPAAQVAALAAGSGAVIQMRKGAAGPAGTDAADAADEAGWVDASSVLGLLTLATRAGDDVAIRGRGEGAAQVLDELAALVSSGFGEAPAPG